MVQSKEESLSKVDELPEGIQKYVNEMMQAMVDEEKEGYDNKLVPFSQHEAQMKAKGQAFAHSLYSQIQRAEAVLKKELELEEANVQDPPIPYEAFFARWEEAAARSQEEMEDPNFSEDNMDMEKSMQEQFGISDAFMHRAYSVARRLIEEKRFEEGADLFMFLRYLNSIVFEYWLGEASCLHEIGRIQEALDGYEVCALIQPENPYVFFQMASCMYQLKEIDASLEAIKTCIEHAKNDEGQQELLQHALEAKRAIELEKVA